jgi:hypothetical protein
MYVRYRTIRQRHNSTNGQCERIVQYFANRTPRYAVEVLRDHNLPGQVLRNLSETGNLPAGIPLASEYYGDSAPAEGWSDTSQNCLQDMRIIDNA